MAAIGNTTHAHNLTSVVNSECLAGIVSARQGAEVSYRVEESRLRRPAERNRTYHHRRQPNNPAFHDEPSRQTTTPPRLLPTLYRPPVPDS